MAQAGAALLADLTIVDYGPETVVERELPAESLMTTGVFIGAKALATEQFVPLTLVQLVSGAPSFRLTVYGPVPPDQVNEVMAPFMLAENDTIGSDGLAV